MITLIKRMRLRGIYICICLEAVCPRIGFQHQVRIKSAVQPETQKYPQMVVILIQL